MLSIVVENEGTELPYGIFLRSTVVLNIGVTKNFGRVGKNVSGRISAVLMNCIEELFLGGHYMLNGVKISRITV